MIYQIIFIHPFMNEPATVRVRESKMRNLCKNNGC